MMIEDKTVKKKIDEKMATNTSPPENM